jgi:hypothetical protein
MINEIISAMAHIYKLQGAQKTRIDVDTIQDHLLLLGRKK